MIDANRTGKESKRARTTNDDDDGYLISHFTDIP